MSERVSELASSVRAVVRDTFLRMHSPNYGVSGGGALPGVRPAAHACRRSGGQRPRLRRQSHASHPMSIPSSQPLVLITESSGGIVDIQTTPLASQASTRRWATRLAANGRSS